MTELEIKQMFKETYPDFMRGDEPLRPYFDIWEYAIEIATKELEAQIEKIKYCGNCENGELSAHEEPCRHCQRCFASKDVTDQENVKDNWEAIKEIKEK